MAAKTKTTASRKPAKAPRARMSLAETMSALEKAGTAQARKTYARHGGKEPMFGVAFSVFKTLLNRIGVDHELACALWDTGNLDARILAMKVADPARISPTDLDRWAGTPTMGMCNPYVANLAVEGPHARSRAEAWLGSKDDAQRAMAWSLVGAMAMRDESTPDSWFVARLSEIERSIKSAPNSRRGAMNQAVIAIGCRSAPLRTAAKSAAKRIGKVELDHGDTACKTPDAAQYIDKAWAHSTSKGFASPAAHERSRESMRTRC